MRLLPALFILTTIEAKPQRLEKDQVDINRRMKNNDVDVYPDRFEATDFGSVFRNGESKQINNEPDMVEPRSLEHAKQLLRKVGSDIVNMKKPENPLGFSSPRDAMLFNKLSLLNNDLNSIQRNKEHRPPRVNNITQSIRKSVGEEIKRKYPGHWTNIEDHPFIPSSDGIIGKNNDDHKEHLFSKSGFSLVSEETYHARNWTTCKQFAKGAVFHPDDVINIPWVPFFIWSTRRFVTSIVHTFTYPTKKLVKQYKEEFGPYLNIQLDWEQPKLLLKESRDMLLIAGDRKGLFYGIPYVELPSSIKNMKIKLPVIIIRLKIVDPYLSLMYCNDKYATIMSVAGTEPETDEKKAAEATFLKFQGFGSPAARDPELEALKYKYHIEKKRSEEKNKYINVERPVDRLDPSLW